MASPSAPPVGFSNGGQTEPPTSSVPPIRSASLSSGIGDGGLVIQAQAKGTAGIAELLHQNLGQEKAAIEKIKAAFELVAREDAAIQEESAAPDAPAIVIPPYLPPGSI